MRFGLFATRPVLLERGGDFVEQTLPVERGKNSHQFEGLAGRGWACYSIRVRCIGYRFLLAGLLAWVVCVLAGCGSFSHKPKSYDRAVTDDERDPTYRENPERADVEVRER
jgi:hypothetical protein